MCCPLVFEFSVGIGGFVIGLGQISFFLSSCQFAASRHPLSAHALRVHDIVSFLTCFCYAHGIYERIQR